MVKKNKNIFKSNNLKFDMQNKRGLRLSTSTIVLIILGVVILAFLILGFTMGWKTLFPGVGGGGNVNTIVAQCETACVEQNTYSFCAEERTLKASDLPTGTDEVLKTCQMLATDSGYESYGIETCPGLCSEGPAE